MYNSLLKLVFVAYLYVYSTEAKRCYGSANYTLTRRGTWTLERHPNSPLLRGFSPTVGCSHNYRYVMWRQGIKATTGVKDLSEMGDITALNAEMDIQIALKKAFKRYSGTIMAGGTSNDTILNIKVNSQYPLVSFIAMLAPSPDWFHGVHDLNLCNTWTGKWRNRVVRKLFPYDAGTDSGVNFTSPNDVTNPPVNIRRITHDIEDLGKKEKKDTPSEMPVEGSPREVPVEEAALEKTLENTQDTSTCPQIPILTANPDFNITLALMLCILNIIGYL
ncbi:Hypothetical predicted protein [Paramuricea clavata]|uniref:Uncharacterized protein n=1 Tax=Paramuricea clavata TaxID=317549 RepID=A0A6S7HS57_PARCT|nr:Hypothetical predicted protein [Paramuricea clavata]